MITEEQFNAYEAVRQSGDTNMFNIPQVITYAEELEGVELTGKEVREIMANYDSLAKRYRKGE